MSQSTKPDKKIRISVDAMGGDNAPAEIVKGAVQAARDLDLEIFLVGIKDKIENELKQLDTAGLSINIVEAKDVIVDGEQAAYAVMKKPESSVVVAAKMVKEGKVDGMVSAGSTGAVMVSALYYVGTLQGIERPMACGPVIGFAPKTVILDLGANVGCQPYQMVEFAIAGSVYAQTQFGVENPTIGLLNVGAEEGKGNDVAKEAYGLLKKSGLNFVGNVEGHDIVRGTVNVIVCDGFVGNILIKFSEGLGRAISHWMVKEIGNKMDQKDLEKISNTLYKTISPGAIMGGGPLWGVDGVVSVAHGASRAEQITRTIKTTKYAIEIDLVNKLKNEFAAVRKRLNMENKQ
jgi:glycerol-3-phosphate acyltransferase PlsX